MAIAAELYLGAKLADSKLEYIAGASPRPRNEADFDVVFVHGLTGDVRDTWTHKNGEFWPKWAADDFPHVNVYCAGYDSSLFSSFVKGDGASLSDRATILLDRIASRPTKGRPVVFVTHSLGGLIVKKTLQKAFDTATARRRDVARNTLGVIFIATPHHGADLATIVAKIVKLGTTKSVKELTHGNDQLLDLSAWFSHWASEGKLYVESYYEIENTNGVLVVDKISANPNISGILPIAIQADHVSITKLADRDCQLYQSFSAALDDIGTLVKAQPTDGGDTLAPEIVSEYEAFTSQASTDRRTLAEKLTAAGRTSEIASAERQKELFAKNLQRNIAQPAAVRRYTRLMSNVETRYRRHVAPVIAAGGKPAEVDSAIQDAVLDPCLRAHDADGGDGTSNLVDSALYYLAGNCHLSWDNG